MSPPTAQVLDLGTRKRVDTIPPEDVGAVLRDLVVQVQGLTSTVAGLSEVVRASGASVDGRLEGVRVAVREQAETLGDVQATQLVHDQRLGALARKVDGSPANVERVATTAARQASSGTAVKALGAWLVSVFILAGASNPDATERFVRAVLSSLSP